jgi:Tfp pilus assembly protein PilF
LVSFLLLTPLALAQPAAKPPAVSPEEEKGRELFRTGKIEEAVEEFRKAGKANPALPPPRIMLAELFHAAGQGPAARTALEKAATEDPEHPAVLLLNASFAYGDGRVTDGLLSCRAALAAADSPRWDAEQRKRFQRDARLGLATGLEARRDYPAAREQLAALVAAEPKNGPLRARLAGTLFLTGKPDDAAVELQSAFRDDPTVGPPEVGMARLWAAKGDAAKAEEWFKKAVAAHPKEARVLREYGGWLLAQGRVDDARPQVDGAVALEPNTRDTAALRGLLARYTKDFKAAEDLFEKLNRDSPADRFAAANLALVLAESADPAKQRRAVELAENLASQVRHADVYAVLGWCYYKAGRLDEALKALTAAVSGTTTDRDTVYYLARVLAERERPDDARKVLKEALAATGPFVNRKDAEALLADLDKKHPPKKAEEKKAEEKK